MIPPLAVTPPPEPATAPAPRGVDRFAGTLARALNTGTRRHRPAADATGGPANAAARPSPDVDADATTTAEAPAARDEPAQGASDELAGAAAVSAIAASVAEPAPGAGTVSGPPAHVVEADAIAVDAAAIGVAGYAAVEPLLAGDHELSGESAGESPVADTLGVSPPAAPAVTGGDRAETSLDRADAGLDAVASAAVQSDSTVAPADGTEQDDPTRATVADVTTGVPADGTLTPLDSSPQPPATGSDTRAAARRSPIEASAEDAAALDPAIDAGPADRTGAPARVEVASSDPTGAARVMPAPVAAAPSATSSGATPSPGAAAAPGTATIAAADAVRYLRELGPARAVQRLAVDLDGAMVAVRVDHTGAAPTVRVQVVDDPAGRLDASWATNVERTLTQTMQRDGAGADAEQRRRDHAPANPDDLRPTGASGRRWALALGGEP